MSLRELIIARILFAVSEDELREEFMLEEEQLDDLSDIDLFELFEDVTSYAQ